MRILYKIANKLFRIVKKILKLLTSRMVIIGVALLLEFCWLAGIMMQLNEKSVYINYAVTILSLIAVLSIINNPKMNPGYKLMWAVCILALPVTGICLYGILGHSSVARKFRTHYDTVLLSQGGVLGEEEETRKKLEEENILAAGQSSYLTNYAHYPVYENTETEYYPLGDVWFEHFIEELKKAEHYIFMEYFIISEGYLWDTVLEILKEKAAAGVDVRVIYDDFGCVTTLPYQYYKSLQQMGIKCAAFNQFRPVLNVILNNRDHRKIAVIDGHTAFTGGINLADEYINRKERFGHWKDTGVRIDGAGAWGFASQFIQMWKMIGRSLPNEDDYYRPRVEIEGTGWCQPFTDGPFNNPDNPVEDTYLQLIASAQKMLYITTPYYAVEESMQKALCIAADAGVDVRLMVPAIPDKWYVYMVAETYWGELLEHGVKIYRYTPGFIHAKTFVVDDDYAVVGTINLDYRSLYLHFECAVWMYQTPSVAQVRDDFFKTQQISQEITLEECRSLSFPRRLGRSVLRVFAPLM